MKAKPDTQASPKTSRISRWFVAALILVAVLFVVRSLAPQTIGETVRRRIVAQLQAHYADHKVSIRRGYFDPNTGLILEGLRIEEALSQGHTGRRELVTVDRLTVMGSFDTDRLRRKENPILTKRVVLEGVHANVWLDDEGQLSLMALMPLPVLGSVAAPRMDLRDVTIDLYGNGNESRAITTQLGNVVILNHIGPEGVCQKDITVSGSADYADKIIANISCAGGATDLRASATGVHVNERLFDQLPRQWTDKFRDARSLRCVLDTQVSIFQNAEGHLNYRVATNIHDGQFNHPAIPYPVSGLRGKVVCDPGGITIEASQARLGDAFVSVVGKIEGYQAPSDVDLKITTRGLMLDDRVAAALPGPLRRGWDKIQPVGRIDIDAKVRCQASVWKTQADLICKGVDIRYEKFPYPIEQLVGRILLRDDMLTTDDLSGRIAGNRMQCLFRMPVRPGITFEKTFTIATDGPVPIDRTLLRSLSPRGSGSASPMETFVRSLNPSGSVRLASATFSTDANNVKTKEVDLRVIDGRITYDHFTYPLYNVTGTVKVKNDTLVLEGFRATNANAGVVQCAGVYHLPRPGLPTGVPTGLSDHSGDALRASDTLFNPNTPPKLTLRFQATDVPMDESLRQSLPDATRQVWDTVSPSGVLDQVDVVLTKGNRGSPLGLDVTARQFGKGQVTNRALSLKPSSLPYRIDITDGTIHFDGSQVRIHSIHGSHDASKLSADGTCVLGKDGRWVLSLDLHSGSRLHPDAQLIASLPEEMREAMRGLQLRGPVSVRGTTQIALPSEQLPQTEVDWDLSLQLEGNRIGDVGPVHSLRGEVLVKGHRDESQLRSEGEVRLDSMHVYDLQITGIRGPFSIVDDRLKLGDAKSSQSIRGKLFGGTIDLDGETILSSGNFDVGLAVRDAQVPTMLAEFGHGGQDVTGAFTGQSQLQGNLGTADLLKGTGAARVRGANLYELPFMVKVFNLLRISPSEDYAFTDGEVEFTLFGDSMTFNDMQIWGDLVSLQGGGTLDRRNELDLTFNTRVSPKNGFTRAFRPLRSPRYTLWTIDVIGPMSNPEIKRRALDGVSETLGRWFPGMGQRRDDGESSADRIPPTPQQASQSLSNPRR